jgi:hypothetical protein
MNVSDLQARICYMELFVIPPEEHHERRTFCRRGGYPRTCDSGSAIDPKEAFADSFQKLYERC